MLSLRDRIMSAKTSKQIDLLLAEGKGYEYASPKTRSRWTKTALTQYEKVDSVEQEKTEKKSKKEK